MGEESDGDAAGDLLADEEDSKDGDQSLAEGDDAATDATEDEVDRESADGDTPDDVSTEEADEESAEQADSSSDDSPAETEPVENGGGLQPVESDETDEMESEDQTDESEEQAGVDASDDADDPQQLQPYEAPDISLDPDEMDPDIESLEESDEELTEEAPLAEDVARNDDLQSVAERNQPLEDEEMPLADHIEEMMKRLAVIVVVAGVVSLAILPFAEPIINFLWDSVLPAGDVTRPRVYAPLGLVMTKLKVASLGGVIVGLPVLVYESYLFMRPGLYPHERRYYLAAVPTSLVLAFVGVSFAYFLVLPVIFEYFLYYSDDVTTIAFALTKTFNLILLMMGYLAIVFQIPLFIMLAVMMGLTTRRWMADRRLYFWGGFLGISFLFSFDPTGMAPFMVAATMVLLFEGTLLLLKWTGR